ncbi:restriction endonuclease subunit S [Chryseobacterium indoltheticum]|uniref:restriction endonuclease subunit S n=1 Tax=Chryseobacterium indoltheticum TaxID=254 RepID=UPI0040433515
MREQIENYSLPKGWIWVSLSDVVLNPKVDLVDGPFGSNLKSDDYTSEGIPVFRIQNIKAGYFLDKNIQYISAEKALELERHSFKQGDVIITKLGEPLGLACKVPAKYSSGVIVADLIRLRPSNIIDVDYLVSVINSKVVQNQFKKITKGTTRARVNLTLVRDIRIPLAPLNEQILIAQKIAHFSNEIEKNENILNRTERNLTIYWQSILKEAFNGKLTEKWRNNKNLAPINELLNNIGHKKISRYNKELENWKNDVKEWAGKNKAGKKPKKPSTLVESQILNKELEFNLPAIPQTWKWIRNNDLLYYLTSGSRDWKKFYSSEGAYFIRTQDIKTNFLELENAAFVNLPEDTEGKRSLVEKGDLLMTITGANVGKIAFIEHNIPESYVSQSVALLKLVDKNFSPFLHLYFQSFVYGGKLIEDLVYGVGRPVLSLENIRDVPVPLCQLEEQNEIVAIIKEQAIEIKKIKYLTSKCLFQYAVLRQSLLQKAFEGNLTEQNENDNSASELVKELQNKRKEHLEKLNKQIKPIKKKASKMGKENTIEEILKSSDKPLNAKEVWQLSKHKNNIEDFYKELKVIQEKVKVITKGTDSLLTLIK